ncbi:hypothetical protein Ddc_18653 [Ditylenchus destructor]|nr:hypothetical protein Ddc_18653 [Ditylenchus destructor]
MSFGIPTNVPPPSTSMVFSAPPPIQQPVIDKTELIMRAKMELFKKDLIDLKTVTDLIEYLWKQGYDKIPNEDPPLLFNEIVKQRRGMLGAATLYQIICYGHPELETYYCGMCNHWTTVSEMFLHLKGPMHRLNYMFRNYKMYHTKALNEPDEVVRDVLLDKFADKIWDLEGSGHCSHRMRCILNQEAIARLWPEYKDCIDNSWKIMDFDDDSRPRYDTRPLSTGSNHSQPLVLFDQPKGPISTSGNVEDPQDEDWVSEMMRVKANFGENIDIPKVRSIGNKGYIEACLHKSKSGQSSSGQSPLGSNLQAKPKNAKGIGQITKKGVLGSGDDKLPPNEPTDPKKNNCGRERLLVELAMLKLKQGKSVDTVIVEIMLLDPEQNITNVQLSVFKAAQLLRSEGFKIAPQQELAPQQQLAASQIERNQLSKESSKEKPAASQIERNQLSKESSKEKPLASQIAKNEAKDVYFENKPSTGAHPAERIPSDASQNIPQQRKKSNMRISSQKQNCGIRFSKQGTIVPVLGTLHTPYCNIVLPLVTDLTGFTKVIAAFYEKSCGFEFLVDFKGSNHSFCSICFCVLPNNDITDHFASEYHIARCVKRSSPSKLLNSEYMSIDERQQILLEYLQDTKSANGKDIRHKTCDGPLPLLLKRFSFPDKSAFESNKVEEITIGTFKAVWCEDCKQYINLAVQKWHEHIFDDDHFENATKRVLCYMDNNQLVSRSAAKALPPFKKSTIMIRFRDGATQGWYEKYSHTLGLTLA